MLNWSQFKLMTVISSTSARKSPYFSQSCHCVILKDYSHPFCCVLKTANTAYILTLSFLFHWELWQGPNYLRPSAFMPPVTADDLALPGHTSGHLGHLYTRYHPRLLTQEHASQQFLLSSTGRTIHPSSDKVTVSSLWRLTRDVEKSSPCFWGEQQLEPPGYDKIGWNSLHNYLYLCFLLVLDLSVYALGIQYTVDLNQHSSGSCLSSKTVLCAHHSPDHKSLTTPVLQLSWLRCIGITSRPPIFSTLPYTQVWIKSFWD